jgi:hypothetical protein
MPKKEIYDFIACEKKILPLEKKNLALWSLSIKIFHTNTHMGLRLGCV